MTEGNYSWPLIELVLHGGIICIFFHALAFGTAAYVATVAFLALRRGTHLPVGKYVCLSFLPLIVASLAIFFYLFYVSGFQPGGSFYIWEIGPIEVPPSPSELALESLDARRESTAATIARMKLYLYAGWLWTALSLLSVRAASRRKVVADTADTRESGN